MELENVKVGDKLMSISGRAFSNKKSLQISAVERITKTQIVLSRDRRVRKDSGREIGRTSVWDGTVYWIEYDEKVIKEISEHNFNINVDRAKKELIRLGVFDRRVLDALISEIGDE